MCRRTGSVFSLQVQWGALDFLPKRNGENALEELQSYLFGLRPPFQVSGFGVSAGQYPFGPSRQLSTLNQGHTPFRRPRFRSGW